MNVSPELQELLSGGPTNLHYHPADSQPTHDTSKRIQELANVALKDSDYDILYADDFLLIDSTAAPVTVTLPLARAGFVVTILRSAGANNVTIDTTGGELVNGAASISITSSYSPVTLKALPPALGAGYFRIA